MSLIDQTATELLNGLNSGDYSAQDVTALYLERIRAHNDRIGAFLTIDASGAMQAADAIDQQRATGQSMGRLAGLPVAVKDNICVQGQVTTCASRMLENFCSPYTATVVEKLRRAGAVILGKTNLDEFAMGSSTENSALGSTRNPWNSECVPGGSSGGAAACIAASMAPLSVGSDTGGSIRQPAAFCGVLGMKPTYGRVSRYGLVAFASSLDQIGPLTRTADDAALLLEVLAGHDPMDSTAVDDTVPAYTQSVLKPLDTFRLGVVREHFSEGLDAEIESAIREAIRVFESLGASVHEVSLPHSRYAIATYYIIAPCEASSNLARYDGVHYGLRSDEGSMHAELDAQRTALIKLDNENELDELDSPLVRMYRKTRAEGFGQEVKRRIMLGTYALSKGYYDAYYLKALKVRRLIREDYDRAFNDVDLVVGPVTPTSAYQAGEKLDDPLSMYLGDLYTVSANLAGLPAISIPCGMTNSGLPIGLQLQGSALAEDRLLRATHMYQQATDWHRMRPNWE